MFTATLCAGLNSSV